MCSDKWRTQLRNVLNWLLLHVIALLEMYCAAYLHKSFSTELLLTCPHRECRGIASVKSSGRQRNRAGSMLLYFLFPLKTDVKSNKKFLSLLPICIIKCYWHNLANQHQPNRQENRAQFILTSHGLHKIPSKLIKVNRHFVFQERFPPCTRRKIQYWCCIKQVSGEET